MVGLDAKELIEVDRKRVTASIDTHKILCKDSHMATNIELDEALVRKAMRMGGSRTKRGAVHEALVEYVARREQIKVLELFGTVEYDPGYDYKAQRRVK
jgi:Arc/MetJ family transcription regulator